MDDTTRNPFELKKEIRLVHGKKCNVMVDYSTSSYGRIAEILGPVDTTNWERLRKEEEEAEKEAKRIEKEKFEQYKLEQRNKMREERDDKAHEIRKETKGSKNMMDKRYVCGKIRSCEIMDGKIGKVYDSGTKLWMSYNDFINKHEHVKKEEKVEEKVEEKKEDIKIEVPKITVTTNMTTPGSSGTGTIFSEGTNVVSVPKVEKKVEKKESEKKVDIKIEDKVKRSKDNRNKDMIDEYIDLLYGGT